MSNIFNCLWIGLYYRYIWSVSRDFNLRSIGSKKNWQNQPIRVICDGCTLGRHLQHKLHSINDFMGENCQKVKPRGETSREGGELQGAIWNKRLWRLSDIRISVESRSGVHVTDLITVRCSGFNYMIIFALRVPSPPWASGLPVPFWTGRPHFIIFSFVRVFPPSLSSSVLFFSTFLFY